MKIRKPEDERFFKDIVLNDILEEISSENGTILKSTHQPKKQKSSIKKIFFIFLSIIIFIAILFKLLTYTDNKVEVTPKVAIPNTQEWKMEKDRVGYKKISLPKVIKEEYPLKKTSSNKISKIKIIPIQKTERELAKEVLRQQLLN